MKLHKKDNKVLRTTGTSRIPTPVTPQLRDQLTRLAEARGCTRSHLVREILAAAVEGVSYMPHSG